MSFVAATFNLHELLQSKSVTVAVRSTIDFGRNKDKHEFDVVVIQFFVNLLDRNFSVQSQDLLDLNDLVQKIYESNEHEGDIVLTQTAKEFLSKFFSAAFEDGVIDCASINSWLKFLKCIVFNETIRASSVFKGETILLLSFCLNPLADLHKSVLNGSTDDNEEEDLLETLVDIMEIIPKGFEYKKLSTTIASEFVDAMENHPEVFISESTNFLGSYMKLLLQENNCLHKITLKSLVKLCDVPAVREKLVKFFFDQRGDESVIEILDEMVGRRSLKLEIILLLTAMSNLQDDRGFINESMRTDLYKNVFSGTKKTVAVTIDLMMALDENFWIEIIKLLNASADVDWDQFFNIMSSIDGVPCNSEALIKVILENLNDPATSQRAASILVECVKRKKEEIPSILEQLDTIFLALDTHEKTTVILLDLIDSMDICTLCEFYKGQPEKFISLISCFTQFLEIYEDQLSLYRLVFTLKKITKISPKYVTERIRIVHKKFYNELLSVNMQTEQLCELYEKPLKKLSILLENRTWNIISMQSLEVIMPMLEKLCEDNKAELFPVAARFYTNCFKQLWTRLILGKPVPFSDVTIKSIISHLFVSLADCIENPTENLEQTSYSLCSFMDIAVMFQPLMRTRYSHTMFTKIKFSLKKTDIQLVASVVEETVFKYKENNEINRREMILLSWISFCRNYIELPSLTASEKIIRYYRPKGPFKQQIEILMDDILSNNATKNIFEQIVAFATMNLCNLDDFEGFLSFYQAIEEFLAKKFKDENKKLSIKSTICSQMLSKLKNQVDVMQDASVENRLLVLNYVAIIIKNMEPAFKQKLALFMPQDLENCELNEVETKHLASFKQMLASTR